MGVDCRRWRLWGALLMGLVLAGCSTHNPRRVPVEDRGSAAARPIVSTDTAVKLPPGLENAGKAGYYTVKPGDTIMRIGLETGQAWRDLARWNNLDNPNVIEVGQVLRVFPPSLSTPIPATATAPASASSTVPEGVVVARPVTSGTVTPVTPASGARAAASAPAAAPATAASTPAATADDEVAWLWPSTGAVLGGFDEVRNKGLDIAGRVGDPVLAAADGRVVYAGAGLRGYGNLVILKHNNTYLTAYAHNQALLVKEDQTVRRGQKIAEMGSSDAERVKLHFEIRRLGKPVDPAKLLPPR